jgi:hypothetical protein
MTEDDAMPAIELVLGDPDHLSLIFSALPTARVVLSASEVARSWRAQSSSEHVWRALFLKKWGHHHTHDNNTHPLRDLRVHQVVEIQGLRSRPDLNGKLGRLETWLKPAGRWAVNLCSRPVELNSTTLRPDPQPMRFDWTMPMRFEGKPIKVRPENLVGTWRLRYRRRSAAPSAKQQRDNGKLLIASGVQVEEGSLLPAAGTNEYFRSEGDQRMCRFDRALDTDQEDAIGYFEACVTGSSVGLTCSPFYNPKAEPPRRGIHVGWAATACTAHSDPNPRPHCLRSALRCSDTRCFDGWALILPLCPPLL